MIGLVEEIPMVETIPAITPTHDQLIEEMCKKDNALCYTLTEQNSLRQSLEKISLSQIKNQPTISQSFLRNLTGFLRTTT